MGYAREEPSFLGPPPHASRHVCSNQVQEPEAGKPSHDSQGNPTVDNDARNSYPRGRRRDKGSVEGGGSCDSSSAGSDDWQNCSSADGDHTENRTPTRVLRLWARPKMSGLVIGTAAAALTNQRKVLFTYCSFAK